MEVCRSCGRENPEGARFCNACAAPTSAEAPAGIRKTVTVFFCDLVGSTSMGDRADPELLRELMGRYHGEVRGILERHGGTVEKFVGDAAMAVFGIPQVHEDDALRAARAASEIRDGVARLGLEVRIGVNTGEVVAGEGETLITGDAVNVAARLEQAADAGEILLGEATERLVRDVIRAEPVEPLDLKGKAGGRVGTACWPQADRRLFVRARRGAATRRTDRRRPLGSGGGARRLRAQGHRPLDRADAGAARRDPGIGKAAWVAR